MIKTPEHWYKDFGIKAALLMPIAWLYGLGRRMHVMFSKQNALPVRSICLGNLTSGGSGKTPCALAVMHILQSIYPKKNLMFLSRGYGGTLQGPVVVDHSLHKSHQVGEEPLFLAQKFQTVISKNRMIGAYFARDHKADLLVLDDGFQNPSIGANVNLLVIDGAMGIGNGALIPAGPLREPIHDAMKRADAILFVGKDQHGVLEKIPSKVPVFKLRADLFLPKNFDKSRPALAFAGIGYPQKFYDALRLLGVNIIVTHDFPDHYHYTQDDIDRLIHESQKKNAQLITTEKDAQKLSGFDEYKDIHITRFSVIFDPQDDFESFIKKAMSKI